MKDKDITSQVSLILTIIIQLILIAIKLFRVVDWPWWIILIPTELTLGLTLLVFITIFMILIIEMGKAKWRNY